MCQVISGCFSIILKLLRKMHKWEMIYIFNMFLSHFLCALYLLLIGLRATDFWGNFSMLNTTDVLLPAIDSDKVLLWRSCVNVYVCVCACICRCVFVLCTSFFLTGWLHWYLLVCVFYQILCVCVQAQTW